MCCIPSGGRPAEKASPRLGPGWCIVPKNGRWCEKEPRLGGMIAPVVAPGVDDRADDDGAASCLVVEYGFEEDDPPEDLDERLFRRQPPPTGTLRREPPRVQ
jgi:hypothetical protein